MQTFREGEDGEEGSIELRFPATWKILKYDDPKAPFYQGTVKRTGADLSAVDFVVNPKRMPTVLLLIEVKDFRKHEVENRARLKPGELAVEITRNALHTLAAHYAGVRADHKTLREIAPAVLPAPAELQLVLLLEENPLPEAGPGGRMSTKKMLERDARQKKRANVLTELEQRLTAFNITTKLYRCADIPSRAGWEAVAFPQASN